MKGEKKKARYLAHHFLDRAKLDHLTIQNIISTVNLDDDQDMLLKIQKRYENIVNETKENKTYYGIGYRKRSRSYGARDNRDIR